MDQILDYFGHSSVQEMIVANVEFRSTPYIKYSLLPINECNSYGCSFSLVVVWPVNIVTNALMVEAAHAIIRGLEKAKITSAI